MVDTTLTDLTLRTLKPGAERYEIFDPKLPGFGVRVAPSGLKTFFVFYWYRGRQRRMTVGRYPAVSLSNARRLALDAMSQVAHGTDPQRSRTEQRSRHRFEDVVDDFLRLHCERRNRPSTITEASGTLRRHFAPQWASRDVREIERHDVLLVLDRLMEQGKAGAANRALAVVRKLFNWCVERGLIAGSPCTGIKMPAPPCARDRVLSDDELAAVWHAAAGQDYPFSEIVQLLILTGQRRSEVADMRWCEIDLAVRSWTIPAARSKNKKSHVVPLSAIALTLISSMPRYGGDRLFPARGNVNAAYAGFNKAKPKLDALSGVRKWTLHDLRRTAATGMARLGVAPHVVERILNHKSGSLGGVAGIYNRFGYLPEMRAALDAWAAHIEHITSGRTAAAE